MAVQPHIVLNAANRAVVPTNNLILIMYIRDY